MGAKRKLVFSANPRVSRKRARTRKAVKKSRTKLRSRNGVLGNSYGGTLKYYERVTPTAPAAANVVNEYIFNLNSIYDPNVSGGGHQPYGRDTLATLYERYRVYKVKYCITARPAGNTATVHYAVVHDAALTYNNADPSTFFEQPHCQYVVAKMDAPVRLKGTVNLQKFFGVARSEYNDDRFQATFGTSPAELIRLSFGHSSSGGTPSITYDVYLKYYVKCMDPKMLAQS